MEDQGDRVSECQLTVEADHGECRREVLIVGGEVSWWDEKSVMMIC